MFFFSGGPLELHWAWDDTKLGISGRPLELHWAWDDTKLGISGGLLEFHWAWDDTKQDTTSILSKNQLNHEKQWPFQNAENWQIAKPFQRGPLAFIVHTNLGKYFCRRINSLFHKA